MLIKWENFGAFLSCLLRREIFLTGDFLNEFNYYYFLCLYVIIFYLNYLVVVILINYSSFALYDDLKLSCVPHKCY
jgi:hypothetical protein